MAHPDWRGMPAIFDLRIRVAAGEFTALPFGAAATWDIARAPTGSLSIRLRDRACAEDDLKVTCDQRESGGVRAFSGRVRLAGDAPEPVLFANFLHATVGSVLLEQMISFDWGDVPFQLGGRRCHLVHVTGTSVMSLCGNAVEKMERAVPANRVHSLLMQWSIPPGIDYQARETGESLRVMATHFPLAAENILISLSICDYMAQPTGILIAGMRP